MKKKSYKKFTLITIVLISLFSLYHLYIYTFYTFQIFAREDHLYIGDIARVGYQIDALYPRKLEYTLPKKQIQKDQYNYKTEINNITLCNSFSNAVIGGHIRYLLS